MYSLWLRHQAVHQYVVQLDVQATSPCKPKAHLASTMTAYVFDQVAPAPGCALGCRPARCSARPPCRESKKTRSQWTCGLTVRESLVSIWRPRHRDIVWPTEAAPKDVVQLNVKAKPRQRKPGNLKPGVDGGI